MLVSDDLEALADIKRLLDDQDGILNLPSLPHIVELTFHKAIEMKDLLEMFLGVSSSDVGVGGLGGMIGGSAQNAIGRIAGQTVCGGDSGAVASDLLTGEVRIDTDALKNVLLVKANPLDHETIMEYVKYFEIVTALIKTRYWMVEPTPFELTTKTPQHCLRSPRHNFPAISLVMYHIVHNII